MLYSSSFLAMAGANLFTVSSVGTFFLLPIFIKNHGGSKADIGIVMSALALASVFCRPWISEMIDRIGRKKSYTIGSLIMSTIPIAYLGFEGDIKAFYFPLLVVRIIHGIGLAICFTSAFTYIADIIPEGRLNEGLGIFGISGLAGMAVGPVLGEWIIRNFGFPAFFLFSSGIASIGLIFHLPLRESYSEERPKMRYPSFFSVLRKKKISTIVVLAVLFGFGLSAIGSFVTPFAEEKRCSFISLYYIAYSISAVVTRIIGGRIADRVGEERIVPYGFVMTGTGIFIMALLGGNFILVSSGLLTGLGHGFLFPSLNALAIRNESIWIRGKIIGLFTGGIDVGSFSGSILLGYIGELLGYRGIFFISGLSLLMGVKVFQWRTELMTMSRKAQIC